MKFKKLVLLSLLFSFFGLFSQNQVSWKTRIEPQSPKVGETAKIVFDATIASPWHIYGTEDPCDGMGPLVTKLSSTQFTGCEKAGSFKAIGFSSHFDEAFGCKTFEKAGSARFEIPVKVTSENINIKGIVEYQICKDGMCLPPMEYEINANFTAQKSSGGAEIKNSKIPAPITDDKTENTDNQINTQEIKTIDSSGKPCDICQKINDLERKINAENGSGYGDSACSIPRKAGWDDIEIIRATGTTESKSLGDIFWFVMGAFLAGLVTVFTPCVFPMLPMTISFFSKKNKTKAEAKKQILLYGFFIVLIYTSFGVIAGRLFGEEFAYGISTNWIVNLVFFAIFVVFALSFLGMFEITLPNSLVNNVDAKADKGGIVGTFFMALALVLVSFSCTGPIVGSIIVLSAQGEWLVPAITMLAFSVAFALPFTLSAIFPEFMQKLPKSGGWLNSIKVVLGLLELALAFKFLSQADQVKDWRILDREIFLVIWIAIFFTIAIYLFGKIRFSHDSPIEKISTPRAVLAISSLAFSLYLIPGLWGAPLKSMAGLLPPLSTQDFVLGNEAKGDYLCGTPMYGDRLHIAHDIKGYFDLRQAICCAKSQNKPLFIDFTGKTCANCRLVEQKVWSDPRVLKMLKEDFVVASLYTDYNEVSLPKGESYTSQSGKEITTLGKSLQDFQKTKFGTIGLPTYAIVAYDGEKSSSEKVVLKELVPTGAYTSDVEAYLSFLRKAKEEFGR